MKFYKIILTTKANNEGRKYSLNPKAIRRIRAISKKNGTKVVTKKNVDSSLKDSLQSGPNTAPRHPPIIHEARKRTICKIEKNESRSRTFKWNFFFFAQAQEFYGRYRVGFYHVPDGFFPWNKVIKKSNGGLSIGHKRPYPPDFSCRIELNNLTIFVD